MPGRRGLDVLGELRREVPHARVVMVTKSEEDRTLVEAIGRRVDEYLVKPASPRQVLSVVTRLLEGQQLQQQRAAQDFAARFAALSRLRDEAASWQDFFAVYDELVAWELRLEQAGERGLVDSVQALLVDVRREFGGYISKVYGTWTDELAQDRPPLSVDVIESVRRAAAAAGHAAVVHADRLSATRSMASDPLRAVRRIRHQGRAVLQHPADCDAVFAQRHLQR